jgi:hypothetical protein
MEKWGNVAMPRQSVGLGSSKNANAKLHTWMQANEKPGGIEAEAENQENHAKKTNQTKA